MSALEFNASSRVVYDFTGFDGSGSAPDPTAGELNCDHIITTGFLHGSSNFGDSGSSGEGQNSSRGMYQAQHIGTPPSNYYSLTGY